MTEDFYLQIRDDIAIKLITFAGSGEVVVYFIPGWIVDMNNFLSTIEKMQEGGYTVIYFEMRDKKSARFSRKETRDDFLIERFAEDLHLAIEKLNHPRFNLFSSSLGVHITLRYLANQDYRRPMNNIIVIPALEIRFKRWQRLFIRIPLFFRRIITIIVELYMKRNFVHKDEPETAYKFSEKLYEIDLKRVQLFAQAMDSTGGINLYDLPPLVNDKLLVVGAENDLLHPETEIQNFCYSFANGKYINLFSNKYTHGPLMGEVAIRYFKNLGFDDLLSQIIRDQKV